MTMDWKQEPPLYVLELENGKFYVGQANPTSMAHRRHPHIDRHPPPAPPPSNTMTNPQPPFRNTSAGTRWRQPDPGRPDLYPFVLPLGFSSYQGMPMAPDEQLMQDGAISFARSNRKAIAECGTDIAIFAQGQEPIPVFMAGERHARGIFLIAATSGMESLRKWKQAAQTWLTTIQKRKPRLEAGVGVSWSLQGVVSFRSLELIANL